MTAASTNGSLGLRLKMHPWKDWHEWANVYHLLFNEIGIQKANGQREIDYLKNENQIKNGNLKRALGILTLWTSKNVGGDLLKYVKM